MKIIFLILFLCISAFSQKEKHACSTDDKSSVIEYFSHLQDQSLFISECLRNQNKPDINAKPFRKISHLNPSVINLTKPIYPEIARNNGLFGTVAVEIMFDESGKVFYAKAVRGKMIFYRNAEKAACASKFTPVRFCEKFVKQRGIILYNFSF